MLARTWTVLWALGASTAMAGARDVKAARSTLDEVIELVDRSDARCASGVQKRAEELRDTLGEVLDRDASARRALARTRELRDYVEQACPRHLAGRVTARLDEMEDSLTEARDEERPRRRRARDDDDDEDRGPRVVAARMVRHDCGTGADDPGCGQSRGGAAAMDREAWVGFITALRANRNELLRLDSVKAVVQGNALTARQLGEILDCFQNELLRLDAARASAPRVVDPSHALAHASKWRNTLLANDFTRLFSN